MIRSLRAREFAAIVTAVVASIAVTVLLAVVLVRGSTRADALESLGRQAALIAEQQRVVTPGGAPLTTLGMFFHTQQESLSILSSTQARLLLPPGAAPDLQAGRPTKGSVNVNGRGYLYAAQPERRLVIVLLRPASLEAGDIHPYTIAFLIAAAVGIAIAALAAFILARAVSRPIERVSKASLALAAGDRPGPLPVKGSTEVAALAASFNKLADDLDRARDAERSFLLSVSHELKTPLAAIHGHGEALLDGVMAIPKAASVIVRESKRLDRLIRDLLDLGRLSQHSFSVRPEPVELARLATDAVSRHEPDSLRLGVLLQAETEGAAPAIADPDRTVQVLSNLIENALRSTPAGGTVTVRAAPGLLEVADTGPGLAPDELPRAFERFFLYSRYAKNGTAGQRAVGTGLGLAIVQELTQAMNGTVSLESRQGEGTIFTVHLPEDDESLPRTGDLRKTFT